MTTDTDPRVHPDAHQLASIADLLPTLSGADPIMLQTISDYLRGLSLRVKVLPVARTGPLRVAAEAVSAPVEAVPDICGTCDGRGCPTCHSEPEPVAYLHTVRQVGEGASETPDLALSFTDDYFPLAGIWESVKVEPLYLSTPPPQAEPSRADVDHLNGMVREAVRGLEERDADIARLTEELADEKAVVDVLRSELQDRLQKQRAAEAELQEVRKDAGRHDELSRDNDGDICIDYCNAAGMLSMSFSPTGRMFYAMNAPGASQGGGVEVARECHAILEEELRRADAAMTKEKPCNT